ncbi:MAG: hypothetical protein AAGG99_09000, partial [Pseudomonadota bacterium]
MTTYCITFDIAGPVARTEHQLAKAIMTLGDAWSRARASVWYVRTDMTADDIETLLDQWLADDDRLIVQAVSDDDVSAMGQLRWFRRRGASAPLPMRDHQPTIHGQLSPMPRDVVGGNIVAFRGRTGDGDAL